MEYAEVDIGHTTVIQHQLHVISTTDDIPIRTCTYVYQVSTEQQKCIDQEVQDMIVKGIIHPSFYAPVI